jgi:NhaP-type Na+/H+ or K+/H+ antiporter
MSQLNISLAVAGSAVVLIGLISTKIDRGPLSSPLLALGAGVLFGPVALGWIEPDSWGHPDAILKEAARLTLAVSVMGIALRTPVENYRKLARPTLILLTFGMVLMWAVSAGLTWAILGLAPWVALALGAALTPTDPVVASSIVSGAPAERGLPDRLRSTLSLESGANDGLGYLFVMLPVHFMSHQPGAAWAIWLRDTVLIGVLLAAVIGAVIGWGTARVLKVAMTRSWAEKHSELSLTVALSLAVLALAKLAGSDGILAAFAAGVAFNLAASRKEDREEENVQEAISKLFNLPVFVLLGAALPIAGWQALGWTGVALAVGILLLRRPLTLLICGPFLGAGLTRADTVFLGWFGPIGVAALYYALHLKEATGEDIIWHATSLVVAASVLVHGLTSVLGLRWYPAGQRGAA